MSLIKHQSLHTNHSYGSVMFGALASIYKYIYIATPCWCGPKRSKQQSIAANIVRAQYFLWEIKFGIAASSVLRRSRSSRSHGHVYRQPGVNVHSYGYSFFPRAIGVWNSLSLEAVASKSLGQFQDLATAHIRSLQASGHLKRF